MNNFNCNKYGDSVSVSVFYDLDLAHIYFNDTFERICDDVYYLNDYTYPKKIRAHLMGDWKPEHLHPLNTIDAIEFCEYENKNNGSNWREFANILNDAGISYVITRGYSQGDACYVILPDDQNYDYIDNYFWDAPISVNITVNDVDVYVDHSEYEYDKTNIINQMKSKSDLSDYAKSEIIRMLPDDPK